MVVCLIRMGIRILAGTLRTVKSSIMIMVNTVTDGKKLAGSIITLMQRSKAGCEFCYEKF